MADDNATWRARERQKMQNAAAEEDASGKLYSTGGGGGAYSPYYDANVASGMRTFGAVAVILAILALFIFALILFNGGLSRGGAGVLFTGGNCTCIGRPGTNGLNGRDGQDGTCASPCVDGKTGSDGQNGMCEFHPNCLLGPSGRDGYNGTDGQDGICLLPCINGTNGSPGIQGLPGVCEQPCINGTNGINGVNGTDGVCDCFQNNIEIASLTVNTSLTLDGGNILCPNGGTIDLNCLGINMSSCLDFSACNLQSMSHVIQGPLTGGFLHVGVSGDTVANALSRVFFGDETAGTNWRLNLIRMFASTTTLVGDLLLNLRSRQEVRIETTGILRPIILFATGTLQAVSGTGISMINQFSGNVILGNQATGAETRIQSAAAVRITANTNLFVNSPSMLFEDTFGSQQYMEMDPDQSYAINGTSTIPDLAKRSIIMYQDVIMTAGKRIISLDPSMNVEVGAGLLVTTGRIASGAGEDLTLNAAIGKSIFLEDDATLTTGVLNGGSGVDLVLNAAGGQVIRAQDDVTLTTGIINCPLAGCQLNGNVRVNGNFDTITGGNINAAGDVTAAGMCCTSDPRVKRNITKIIPSTSAQRVMETPVYSFEYSKEYLEADRNAYKGTLRGFMADEVEKHFPYAVRRVKKQVGDVYIEDLMQLNLEMMLADLWAAHQELRREVDQLLYRERSAQKTE